MSLIQIDREKFIEWAMDTHGSLTLYRDYNGTTTDEDGIECLPEQGTYGGEIQLIAQHDSGTTIYAETTDDISVADYLIGECCSKTETQETVESVLDCVFGSQKSWPDNYAQTHGWRI